ncbi:MAG: NADH-quinone oxidoreductase subunit H [Bacteroidales bacterium]|jgi:formate hydrogenlyase subunit 4|nr:NADH-quinone oxidoreductase subunit H [Bacteroidales bacterium]
MLSLVLIFLASLFFPGLIRRTRSILSGRKGPGIFQPVYDYLRLFRKGAVYSHTVTPIFKLAPVVYFSSLLFAAFFVPLGSCKAILSFDGDFIVFACLLALGKFFLILMALDTGSSFEGMGASREAMFSFLAEPAFFILIGSFALLTGHTSFYDIYSSFHFSGPVSYALAMLAGYVLLLLAAIENSRLPVDDPETHLELTMVHEVMILDNSGFDLGLIKYAGSLKFAVFGTLIANFFIGPSWPFYWLIPVFFFIQALSAILIGCVESFGARFRMSHNAQFIFTLTAVSLLIFFGVLLMPASF